MNVQPVVEALSAFQSWLRTTNDDHMSLNTAQRMNAAAEMLRQRLLREDLSGFEEAIDQLLANDPDLADFLLEDLFDRLAIADRDDLNDIIDGKDPT